MPKDESFEAGGHRYRIAGKLDAIKQFHVVRRLAPLVSAFQGVDLAALRPEAQTSDPETAAAAMQGLVGPLAQGVAKISDADSEYVLAACMGVVERDLGGGTGWGPVWSAPARAMMYADITFIELITIVGRVLMANVGDFGFALPRPGQPPEAVRPKA